MTTRLQGSASASGLAVVGAVVTTAANFGIAWLVSQGGAELAGVFFVATAIVAIAGNSSCLGTMTGMVYFLPQVMAADAPNPRGLLVVALRPVLMAASAAAATLGLAAPVLADVVAEDQASEVTLMLRILAALVIPWAATMTLLGTTRGLGTVTPTVVVNQILRPALQLLGLGALFLVDSSPPVSAVAIAWGLPILLGAAVALWSVGRLGGLRSGNASPVERDEFWTYTRPRAASSTMQIALERLDVVLVSALVGTGPAGVYGALTRYITAGNFLIFSVAQAVSAQLRSAIVAEAWDRARLVLRQVTGWLVLVTWPYFLLVGLKREPLAELLNPDFVDDARLLPILAMGMMFSAAAGPIDLTLLMLGRSRASLLGTVIAITTDVVLLLALAPRYGLLGAAIAWSLSVVAQNTVASWLVFRVSGLRAWSRSANLAAALAVSAVVPAALLTPNSLGGLVVAATAAAAFLAGAIVVFRRPLGLSELLPSRFTSSRLSRPG